MKKLVLVFFLLNILPSYSQHDFGIKADGGLSRITTNVQDKKTSFLPSCNAGLFYLYHARKNSVIGIELLYVQINGKEHTETKFTDQNGNYTGGVLKEDMTRRISYLSVPVYYGLEIRRFIINAGLQASFQLNNSFDQKGSYPYNGGNITYKSSGKLKLSAFDAGLHAGLIFKLTRYFSIDANYYYGLYNIDSHYMKGYGIILRNQQVSIGLRYKFYSLPGKEKK